MVTGDEAEFGVDRARETAAFSASDELAAPMPTRPAMADSGPAPIVRPIPPPWMIRVARRLWIAGFIVSGIAVLIAFVTGTELRDELAREMLRVTPGENLASITGISDAIYWASLALTGVVIAVEAMCLTFVMNGKAAARWFQVVALLLHGVVALLADAFLSVGTWGVAIATLLIGGFCLAVLAWFVALAPGSWAWFRRQRELDIRMRSL